jgi:hypothetical protein
VLPQRDELNALEQFDIVGIGKRQIVEFRRDLFCLQTIQLAPKREIDVRPPGVGSLAREPNNLTARISACRRKTVRRVRPHRPGAADCSFQILHGNEFVQLLQRSEITRGQRLDRFFKDGTIVGGAPGDSDG